jgi:hypothetical protein
MLILVSYHSLTTSTEEPNWSYTLYTSIVLCCYVARFGGIHIKTVNQNEYISNLWKNKKEYSIGDVSKWSSVVLFVLAKINNIFQLFVDLQYMAEVRRQIPVTVQKRDDLYAVNPVTERWSSRGSAKRNARWTTSRIHNYDVNDAEDENQMNSMSRCTATFGLHLKFDPTVIFFNTLTEMSIFKCVELWFSKDTDTHFQYAIGNVCLYL